VRFLVAAFMAVFSHSTLAGERMATGFVCVTEQAIMSVVEAELNGGVPAIQKALFPLLITHQCKLSGKRSFIVNLKKIILEYKTKDGKSVVWETERGLFVIGDKPDDSV